MTATATKKHLYALALDRGSARNVDENGFLHVEGCHISKATVNPYWGAEIPDYAELGLDPEKVYYLFRDPKELEKGASTFNNLPLMDYHVEVSADELENPDVHEKVVGATGTGAQFSDPYLINDLVIWTAGAIEGVKSKQQTELSCAYRYKLDMTPGEFQGQKYDGRMYDIVGNHVALVDEGRAGHDVTVKDGKPKGLDKLTVKIDTKGIGKFIADALGKFIADALSPVNVKRAMGMGTDTDTDPIPDLIMKITQLKAQIEDELKPGVEGEDAKVLDDCTSALDSAVHHLLDYAEDQDGTVKDSNPEGINQYTGAAGHADRVGKAAGKAGGPSHKDAQAAHTKAANAARKEGNNSASNAHLRVAAAHGALHANPGNAGAQATLAGHYGKGGDAAVACDKIEHREGHKDSSGKAAPWVIRSESTGKVIWSGPTKEAAVAQLKNVEGHKASAKDSVFARMKAAISDANPEGVNKYTGGGQATSKLSSHANAQSKLAVSKSDHRVAARAHRAAASAHEKAGNPREASYHAAKAREHSVKAR